MTQPLTLTADSRLDADWWRQAVVYQVYPRSFADSDGDGIGDIPGITSRIAVPRRPGRRRDLAQPVLPVGAGRRRLRRRRLPQRPSAARDSRRLRRPRRGGPRRRGAVIVDIVPNHTSDLHPWFQEALAAAPGSPARARYIFRDGTGPDGSEPPSDWISHFGGPAWTRVPDGQWYCHLFAREQPDLNWDNREVRDDFLATLRFWADRGVDGFRVDVAHALAKDLSEPLRSKPTLEDEGVPARRSRPALRPGRGARDLRRVAAGLRLLRSRRARRSPRRSRPPSGARSTPDRPASARPSTSICSRPTTPPTAFRDVITFCLDEAAKTGSSSTWVLQQPRRRPTRHPLCVAARTGSRRLAVERRRVAGRRRGAWPAPRAGRRLVDAGPARLVVPLPG